MDGSKLAAKENNFIAAISCIDEHTYGIAYTDLSTGESKVSLLEGDCELLLDELSTIGAKEVVACQEDDEQLLKRIEERSKAVISYEHQCSFEEEFHPILVHITDKKMHAPHCGCCIT